MERLNIGTSEFRVLREDGGYYVDKTLLIKDIIDKCGFGVWMFNRPRGFGSTMNMSMLDAFFNIEYKGNTWFDGLAISEYPEYDGYRNAFPVIRLDLQDAVSVDYEGFIAVFRRTVKDAFDHHRYLLEASDSYLERTFQQVDDGTMKDWCLGSALKDLSVALTEYHG